MVNTWSSASVNTWVHPVPWWSPPMPGGACPSAAATRTPCGVAMRTMSKHASERTGQPATAP
eukprot:5153652-Prymnesium_polylepis.1